MNFTWQIRTACIVVVVGAIAGPVVWGLAAPHAPPVAAAPKALTEPKDILAALEAGNARFVASKRAQSIQTHRDDPLRRLVAQGQHPIVTLLTCADSRIAPEFVFDQHLGNIFDVRNAGNVVENVGLGSIEYGVEHLHTPVVMVLGHKGCGAVAAVNQAGDGPLPHHLKDIQALMAGLKPQLKPKETDAAFLVKLSEENAKQQAAAPLARSEVLREAVKEKHAIVVAAIYDLETGEVKFLDRDVKAK